jgi:hypothetical protein
MSPLFIKLFRKEHKCPHCPARKQGKKSLCAFHLRLARERWQKWSDDRRNIGRCTYCNRLSFRGFLRCKLHTEYNRTKVAAWHAAHPDYKVKQWAEKKKLIEQGICPCAARRPLTDGYRRCGPCRERRELLASGLRMPWEGTSLEQRMER